GRSKRCIVLDKAMGLNDQGNPTLLTDPADVKAAAIQHFKTIAGAPPEIVHTLDSLPPKWADVYSPVTHVSPDIYLHLTDPVTVEEWDTVIASLPNGKAAGPSGIPYEMLKQLPANAQTYLRDFISKCFSTSMVPSAWRDATIYPIPKPQEWHHYLKNTRPITLIDTTRKVMTRIMYNRIANILVKYKVLLGGNYAGLPGGSCDPPIAALEAIIRDAHHFEKPLFIFQQDISKAFDSIDTNMLRLALQRLRIPNRFIDLTLDLFTNRFNTIITAFGNTDPYKVQIGIDQGEVISPLLWVIYIDPLLTLLNGSNSTPYIINNNSNVPPVQLSTLCYMDDTNLISSSIEGLRDMLLTAQEFYNLNNTKVNFSKAVLVCNRDPNDPLRSLKHDPDPFHFDLGPHSFTIKPLPYNDSFRFLGVWFTLSLSSSYVKKQCAAEYNLFASKLKNKRFTSDQLVYLHNMVLLPKVDFRLKTTLLSERECNTISAPYKRIFKQALQLCSAIPSALLHFNKAFGLTNLYQRQITNHSAVFSKILDMDHNSISKQLLDHRLF